MGVAPAGLPVAVQLLGPADAEPVLLRGARALEADGDPARIARGWEREVAWPGNR
jgi:Asp-tRNA(Asn)/Glu-tRNA(Gln) amidotransferase A subunit family amidase